MSISSVNNLIYSLYCPLSQACVREDACDDDHFLSKASHNATSNVQS